MLSSARLRSRKLVVLFLAIPTLLLVAVVGNVSTASAAGSPQLVARADCLGNVTFTTSAANPTGSTPQSRAATNVDVAYSVDGSFVEVPTAAGHAFSSDDNFTFTDTFALPATVQRPSTVALSVTADGSSASIPVALPATCASTLATVSPAADPVATAQVTTTTTPQSAASTGLTTSTTAPTAAAPSTTTPGLSAGCLADASGWTVTFDNSKGTAPVDYLVRDDLGNADDSVIVPAGQVITKQYPFAAVAGTKVAIIVNGVTLATGPSKIDCVDVGATVAPACGTAAGNGALLGFTDTGVVDATFVVTRDGQQVTGSPFTIQPSQLVTQKLLPMTNNTTATVHITGPNGFVYERSVTLACAVSSSTTTPPSVLGTSINRSGLAFTGIDEWPWITLGAVLVVVGIILLRAKANFALAEGYEGVKSDASEQRKVGPTRKPRTYIGQYMSDLFAPSGKHVRRRK